MYTISTHTIFISIHAYNLKVYESPKLSLQIYGKHAGMINLDPIGC